MTARIPYIYLDANVILDVIRDRKEASKLIMEKVTKGEIKACTSYFCLLELFDKEQEDTWVRRMLRNGYSINEILRIRRQRDLNDDEILVSFGNVDRVFVIPYGKNIDFCYLEGTGWDKAVELMQMLNLRSNDAIHLATALVMNCNLLISNDQHFLNNAEKVIPVSTPENVGQKLKELGF